MHPRLILLLLLVPLFCLAQFCLAQSQKVPGVLSPYPDRPARVPIEGAKIFQNHCAACHGVDGRGHGPDAVALKHAVPDLTLISQRNGGRFPRQHIKEFIAGTRFTPPAQGDREMPIWGPIFHQVEADQDWGEVRLDAVTRQVEAIQQK
jgi:mono/diheme cytochrome c family protein